MGKRVGIKDFLDLLGQLGSLVERVPQGGRELRQHSLGRCGSGHRDGLFGQGSHDLVGEVRSSPRVGLGDDAQHSSSASLGHPLRAAEGAHDSDAGFGV